MAAVKRSTWETLLVALALAAVVFGLAWVGRGCARDRAEEDCRGRGHVEQVYGGRGGWVCVSS